ncbi:hypothetical protein BD779DRAFT_1556251, partial [Infundibulicybe gibba]
MYSHPVPPPPSSRTSTSSSNSAASAGWNHQAQNVPGDVPACVRKLLLSTRQLQESLRQWSVGRVSETQVSDIYVQIGTEFNSTILAFAHHRIDLSDIHSVPQELRVVLEQCLSEDPSVEALEAYMPQVRRVLYKLLQALQLRRTHGGPLAAGCPCTPSILV